MPKTRNAFALLCALAVCCAVMYITVEDNAGEVIEASRRISFARHVRISRSFVSNTAFSAHTRAAKGVYGIGGPKHVSSVDAQKAANIFTNTPDGRMRLNDYLMNIEKEITSEEMARKADITAVRSQMDRNFAFNQEARKKLKKAMLHKMAQNAKKAQDDLAKAMRYVQYRFHKAAVLSNMRNKANARRSNQIRAKVARDRAAAANQLRIATLAQQRSMAAFASAANSRITQSNKHVGMNAAQIKQNAKAARQQLMKAMNKFDRKVVNARAEAAKGRSKLAAQLAAQGKATREWANNKLKVTMAKTAAHFRRVRAKMAADRHHADMALKSATSRMTASLNAAKALNDKNFSKTVKNIAAAKAEAKARVNAAKMQFKTKINLLRATVAQQVAKSNARITQLTGVVNKNKLEQAKVNANMHAEMNRMIKIGNKRYKEHLKKDAELKKLIQSNKAATDARLKGMADSYAAKLDKVRATMKKNRAHASRMLAKKTAKLYAAIAKQEKAQMKINGVLAAQTRQAKLDIADELRHAKDDFDKRMAGLHTTITDNDKKFEKKMDNLAGIVRANAVKNAKGRAAIAAVQKSNLENLKADVQEAVHKGEVRMMKAEMKLKGMNAKSRASLNMRITAQVSKLAKQSASQIENLRLSSKASRQEMRRELLYAVRSASANAKNNLKQVIKLAQKTFASAVAKQAQVAKKNAAERMKVAKQFAQVQVATARQIQDATSALNRGLLTLATENRKAIKSTNKQVTAYAQRLSQEATTVKSTMATNKAKLLGMIKSKKIGMSKAIALGAKKANAGWAAAEKMTAGALTKAIKTADSKFNTLYINMAKNRAKADQALSSTYKRINNSIAKQAALADKRFRDETDDIAAAMREARKQVKDARKMFATAIIGVVSSIKDQESRLAGEIAVVSGEAANNRAIQIRVNRRTNAELARIAKLSNSRSSESIRARGKLRAILDENKRAAASEVSALAKLFTTKLAKIRRRAARDRNDAARDLTSASEALYTKIAHVQLKATMENSKLSDAISQYRKDTVVATNAARSSFNAQLNSLTNIIATNHKRVETGFEVLTGVIRSAKTAGKLDRQLIRAQSAAMGQDMQKAVSRAIYLGEALGRKTCGWARTNVAAELRSMEIEVSEWVEAGADDLFKAVQGSHKQIANNYLSLKAYAVTGGKLIKDYVVKGKGRGLSSMGDLLASVAMLSNVKPVKAEGIGAGLSTIPAIFSSNKVKVDGKLSKINGLVNEYYRTVNAVALRWPMGLGKYLIKKLEQSMLNKGIVQVDKVMGRSGNFVYINGHAIGLSNKLYDFESIAVRMGAYSATLAKLCAELGAKPTPPPGKKQYTVAPPEWPGN